jgi:hypothetical protein
MPRCALAARRAAQQAGPLQKGRPRRNDRRSGDGREGWGVCKSGHHGSGGCRERSSEVAIKPWPTPSTRCTPCSPFCQAPHSHGSAAGRRRRSGHGPPRPVGPDPNPLRDVEKFQRRLTTTIHHAPSLTALRDIMAQYQGEQEGSVGRGCVWGSLEASDRTGARRAPAPVLRTTRTPTPVPRLPEPCPRQRADGACRRTRVGGPPRCA